MNICIPNKKQPLAKIYNGDKWILEEKKGTIEKMTDNAYKTLIDNYDENSPDRIDEFINEVSREISDYSGDRTDRIQDYFIMSIRELLCECHSKKWEVK